MVTTGRRFYTCANVDDGECHVWKWWDDAVMEEMRARDIHVLQLAEKVDNLALMTDYDTDQKVIRLEQIVSDLAKEKTVSTTDYDTDQKVVRLEKIVSDLAKEKMVSRNGFEFFVGVSVLVIVVLGMVLMFK